MRILALSDVELPAVYSHRIRERFGDIDLAISCGDLPPFYLEYVVSTLNIPLYYVKGNHLPHAAKETGTGEKEPWGAINLHRRSVYDAKHDLILVGIEGSLRYNRGPRQYTQHQMWRMVLNLVPRLLVNKLRYGRYMDVFVSHAAPEGIHDDTDVAHRGIQAFRWLIKTFKPAIHLHGHVHVYLPNQPRETTFGETKVINAFGFREVGFRS